MKLKRFLSDNFQAYITDLHLPEDPNEMNAFDLEMHTVLDTERVQHLFIVQDSEESDSAYSQALVQVIRTLESRPVDVYHKVWVIKLGSPQTVVHHGAIHRLSIPHTPDQDGLSSQDCAEVICGHVTVYKKNINHVQSRQTSNLSSTSLPPGKFVDGKHLSGEEEPQSWPMSKKPTDPSANQELAEAIAVALKPQLDTISGTLKGIEGNSQKTVVSSERGVEIAKEIANNTQKTAVSAQRGVEIAQKTTVSAQKTADNTQSLTGAVHSIAESEQKNEQILLHIEENIERTMHAAEDNAVTTAQLG